MSGAGFKTSWANCVYQGETAFVASPDMHAPILRSAEDAAGEPAARSQDMPRENDRDQIAADKLARQADSIRAMLRAQLPLSMQKSLMNKLAQIELERGTLHASLSVGAHVGAAHNEGPVHGEGTPRPDALHRREI